MPDDITYPSGCRPVSEDLGPDELIRRLKTLAHTLQAMEQDEGEGTASQYIPLALHLAEDHFLQHESRDVQLLIACCIADVLRVYAPSAPYKDPERIKTIFLFLIQQLNGLKDPKDPAFKRYFYLLENLAYVKSFNMCFELEDCQEIFCNLFKVMFRIVNDEHSGKVKNFMLDMLCPLITESDLVSNELLDIILCNLLEPVKTQKKHAYLLAKELVIKTCDTLEQYIQAFFNNVLLLGREEKGFTVCKNVYNLIYELYTICPSVLLAVLPQLEVKLKSPDENQRMGAVSLLARMFSEKDSKLAQTHSLLWRAFLGRFNDINVNIRTKCVQYSVHFLTNHPELRSDITETLKLRQHDSDENVRYEVVMAIVVTAKRDFEVVSQSEDLLEFVKERMLDKKFKIRKEAMTGLAYIYKMHLSDSDVPQATKKAVTWIKDKILHAYYMTSIEDRLLVERLFNSSLVPFNLPPEERMKKLYYLLATIDDHATRAFLELQKHQTCARRVVAEWLDLHRKPASEQRDKEMRAKLVQMSKFLPDQVKALEFLNKFSQHMLKDKPLLMGMETVVNPETTCKECAETTGAILKKLGQPVMTNLYAGTVKMLLERISSVMIDRDALKILIGYVEDCLNGGNLIEEIGLHPNTAGERGLKILVMISYLFPMMFLYKDIVTHLLTLLQMEGESVPTLVMQVLTFVGKYHSLHRMFTDEIKVVVPICKNYVESGTPKQAKHAIRCLYNNLDNDDPIFAELLEKVKGNLTPTSEHYLTAIVAFGHIAQNLPYKFPAMLKVIVTRKLVKELLVKDTEPESTSGACATAGTSGKARSNSSSVDSEATWCEEADLPLETRCKVEALKAMARWLIGYKTDKISAQKTFRMLTAFITNKGDLLQNQKLSAAEMAWMRIAAGCAMLKICEQKGVGDQFVAEQFYTLSILVNDPVIQVRDRFLEKLHNGLARGLPNRCLPLDFMGLYALYGLEQDRKLKSKARKYMIGDVGKRREYIKSITMGGICDPDKAMELMVNIHPDYMVLFAIAVLAHSPFFTSLEDIEVLKTLRNCLWYVLEPLMTKNEASFAFYKEVIDKAKSCRDATNPDNETANKKLWALCDLLLSLILQKTTNYDFKDLPPEVRIPSMYFKRHEDPHYINTTFYIPGEFWQTDNKTNAGPVGGAATRSLGSSSSAGNANEKAGSKRGASGAGGSGRGGRRGRITPGGAQATNSNKPAPKDDKDQVSVETDAQPASASETKITLLGIEEGGSDNESSQPPLKKTRTDKNSTDE